MSSCSEAIIAFKLTNRSGTSVRVIGFTSEPWFCPITTSAKDRSKSVAKRYRSRHQHSTSMHSTKCLILLQEEFLTLSSATEFLTPRSSYE